MCNAPTHTHVDISKCPSYDGRHVWEPLFSYPFSGNGMIDIPSEESIEILLRCVYGCNVRAKAYYKLIEIIEGE